MLSSGASDISTVSESSIAILLDDDDGWDQQANGVEVVNTPIADATQSVDKGSKTPVHVCEEPFCLPCEAAVQHADHQ